MLGVTFVMGVYFFDAFDFKSPYDKTKYRELVELGCEVKLIRLMAMTLNGSKSHIRMCNEVSKPFATKEGLVDTLTQCLPSDVTC